MKLTASLIAGLVLITATALAESPTEADKKWLEVAGKMVANGKMQVSTPSEARATLFKDWSVRNGYSANVVKTENGYQIEVAKTMAKL